MPNDNFITMHNSEKAWEYTLRCKAWIWKNIKSRNIPIPDQEDLYQNCLIEVHRLMTRYNPQYSLISWARFGILKAMKKYDCTSGIIKLPNHIMEKMHILYLSQLEAEQEGRRLTNEEMIEITGMKILDILTAQEKFNRPNPPEDDSSFFLELLPEKYDLAHYSILNGNAKTIVEEISASTLLGGIYQKLKKLEDVEIYVLVYRFGLDFTRIPQRKIFFHPKSYLYLRSVTGDYNLQEIADFLNLSKERIRQIEYAGIQKIKSPRARRNSRRKKYTHSKRKTTTNS